jgi:bifunctional DNA-binding transcriptional regulator/antitoxin component of YhaV-PrlF toxin-antitoxin module
MAERAIGRIVQNGNSLQVTLPKPMRHALGWQLGTKVLIEQRDGCLVIAELEYALRERALARVAQGLPAPAEVAR